MTTRIAPAETLAEILHRIAPAIAYWTDHVYDDAEVAARISNEIAKTGYQLLSWATFDPAGDSPDPIADPAIR